MLLHADHHEPTTDHDISSHAFLAKDPVERDETFRRLRTEAPVSWHLPIETNLPPEVHGQTEFQAVTRAEDITSVSQHHELFSSAAGSTALHPHEPQSGKRAIILDTDPRSTPPVGRSSARRSPPRRSRG